MKIGLVVLTILWAFAFGFSNLPSAKAENAAQGQKAETAMTQGKFIDLFRKAKNTGKQIVSVSDEATAYIKACCEDRDSAVQLLRDSGFEVSLSGNDPKRIEELNRHWKQSLMSKYGKANNYEEFVSGTRRAGWWPFWDFFTLYSVSLFVKDGKVDHVFANTVADLPF